MGPALDRKPPREKAHLRPAAALAGAALATAAVAALLLASGGAGEGDRRAAPERAGPAPRALSDERTRSTWAHVRRAVVARARPSRRARRLGPVRTRTSDDTPEVVLALAETRAPAARRWVRVRLPMRPNGTSGWVPRAALGPYYVSRAFLRIDRQRRRASLRVRGRLAWSAPVGIGTEANPTPAGRYYVRSRILPLRRGGPYGAFAFGTNGFSPGLSDWPGGGVVGIHGTNRPELIPGRISHGCVRVRDEAILRLRRLMPLGTPIEIV